MIKNEVKYLLGIDGGGTKTEFLLTDINGKEIKRILLGSSNPVNIGADNACKLLLEGFNEILSGIDCSEIAAYAGIAGAKAGNNENIIRAFLSETGFFCSDAGSDIELAPELGFNGKNGVAVIAGTGIVAVARNGEKLYRTGGRGYLIDKGGSGFHFGSDALNSAFSFLDGRQGSEAILRLIEKRLGKSLEDSAGEIYKGGPSFIASFAPVVFEACRLGDRNAAEITDRNAKEIAALINGAFKLSGISEKNAVICGGLAKQQDILFPFIKKYLVDDVSLEFNAEPMVRAAVSKAKRLAGEKIC